MFEGSEFSHDDRNERETSGNNEGGFRRGAGFSNRGGYSDRGGSGIDFPSFFLYLIYTGRGGGYNDRSAGRTNEENNNNNNENNSQPSGGFSSKEFI